MNDLRTHGIISDAEREWDTVIDIDDVPDDILCQHDTCIHPECDCWDTFTDAVNKIAEKQSDFARRSPYVP